MSEQLNQGKNCRLKILYKHKNNIIKEVELNLFKARFNDIIEHFHNDIKKDFPQFLLKKKYFYNGTEIKNHDKILNLIFYQNIKIGEVSQIIVEIYLDEIFNLSDEDSQNYTKIIIPSITSQSLELYIYYPNKGMVKIRGFQPKIINEYCLNRINSKTSHCNTIKYLFLSGGEYNKEIIDDFWMIKNTLHFIKKMKLPSPKCNHTMFPINNKFILFIGGNDKKCYLFNIEKNEFYLLENTNQIHLKPSIFLLNNYIYCFSEQINSLIGERILFSQDQNKWENKWENIPLNFIKDNQEINSDDLYLKNENVLIIFGGENNYVYYPLNNNVENIKNKFFENDFNINSNDNNCYKINKYYNIYIPEDFKNEKKLIVLNKKNRKIHKMKFIPSDKMIKIKYQYKDSNIINEENNIIIKPQIEKTEKVNYYFNDFIEIIKENKVKDKGDKIFKLLKYKKLLNIFKPENKIDEQNELIVNEDFSFQENNEEKRKKLEKSKSGLLLSESTIYEQLIKRESDTSDNPMVNIMDKSNNSNNINNKEEVTKIIPRKHTLSADLIKDEDRTYNNMPDSKDIAFDELIVENENKNGNEIMKEVKRTKPKINLLLSKSSIEEQLINREIENISMNKKDSDNNSSRILSPVKRRLKSSELCSESEDNLNNVISVDAIEVNGQKLGNDNDKKNILYKNKVNLLLSQDSIEEQLINREVDLEFNKKDK